MTEALRTNMPSIGSCNGLGWVTIELNGYGNGRSREDVVNACYLLLEVAFGKHIRWRPIITQPDCIVFKRVTETV